MQSLSFATAALSSSSSGRKGFGSFHSEDIELLVGHADLDLSFRDEVLSECAELASVDASRTSVAASNFCLDTTEWNFLNHGAFGATLKDLLRESTVWRRKAEEQPLRFFDRLLFPLMAHTLKQTARFVHCPVGELVPLQNVTSGLNSVISSVELQRGDEAVCLSLTYGSTKKMLAQRCAAAGAALRVVHIPLPVQSPADVVERLSPALGSRTKLVVLDEVTSNTAMALPVLQLAAACRQLAPAAVVVVDAAHCLMAREVRIYPPEGSEGGQARPHISDVADAWLTNGHKWLSAPKGCAFMWLSPAFRRRGVRPAIISHGFQPGESAGHLSAPERVLSGFAWDGCRDHSALLCVPSALRIWESMHPDGISGSRAVMRKLLTDATALLAAEWHLEEGDFAAPPEMRAGSPMSLVMTEQSLRECQLSDLFLMQVPLPVKVAGISNTRSGCSDKEAFYLQVCFDAILCI